MSSKSVAVVGATGVVGQEMLDVLAARDFPLSSIRPLASQRSAGKTVQFRGEELPVEVLSEDSFSGIDLAFFSAGASISRDYAPAAVDSGAVVVDNSSAFRMDPGIPLVVPEVNSAAISSHQGIIANPNCSTIIMVVALQPVHELSALTRIVVSTYQAASGAGAKGMEALRREVSGEELEDSPFPHRLAGNLIPRIDVIEDNGYTKEEMKMVLETRKIMGLEGIPVSATCVRVPVERAHSESIQVTTESSLELGAIQDAFERAPGLQVIDEPVEDRYPTPLEVAGRDDVFVGRLRQHPDEDATYDFWVVGDQIRKGAALNAVQIAEEL